MKDVQFISELILVVIERKVHGFSQDLLDNMFARYDDLEEADILETEDQIRQRFDEVRSFLLSMEEDDKAVTNFANTFQTFYSLWACVALHRSSLDSPKSTAKKFAAFIKQVKELADAKGLDLTKVIEGKKYKEEVIDFYQNSVGASTELPQRTKRDEALLKALQK